LWIWLRDEEKLSCTKRMASRLVQAERSYIIPC
jgi:hypothetical protein